MEEINVPYFDRFVKMSRSIVGKERSPSVVSSTPLVIWRPAVCGEGWNVTVNWIKAALATIILSGRRVDRCLSLTGYKTLS